MSNNKLRPIKCREGEGVIVKDRLLVKVIAIEEDRVLLYIQERHFNYHIFISMPGVQLINPLTIYCTKKLRKGHAVKISLTGLGSEKAEPCKAHNKH